MLVLAVQPCLSRSWCMGINLHLLQLPPAALRGKLCTAVIVAVPVNICGSSFCKADSLAPFSLASFPVLMPSSLPRENPLPDVRAAQGAPAQRGRGVCAAWRAARDV